MKPWMRIPKRPPAMEPLLMSDGARFWYEWPPGVTGSATPSALCPDLLRYEQLGEADGQRGRVVRAFFWLLRYWPPTAA